MTERKCVFFVYPPVGVQRTEPVEYTFSPKGLSEAQRTARSMSAMTGQKIRVDVNCHMGAIQNFMRCSREGCTVPEGPRQEKGRGLSIAGVRKRKKRRKPSRG